MYEIKLIKEKDIEILAKIFAKTFTEADLEKPWDESHARDYLVYWFKKQPDMFFGAFTEDGQLIGAIVFNIKPWRTGVRCSDGVIFIDISYQKQGVATALLKTSLNQAMEKYNVTIVEAVTFAGQEFPLSWYKDLGFEVDSHAVVSKGVCQNILNNLV